MTNGFRISALLLAAACTATADPADTSPTDDTSSADTSSADTVGADTDAAVAPSAYMGVWRPVEQYASSVYRPPSAPQPAGVIFERILRAGWTGPFDPSTGLPHRCVDMKTMSFTGSLVRLDPSQQLSLAVEGQSESSSEDDSCWFNDVYFLSPDLTWERTGGTEGKEVLRLHETMGTIDRVGDDGAAFWTTNLGQQTWWEHDGWVPPQWAE